MSDRLTKMSLVHSDANGWQINVDGNLLENCFVKAVQRKREDIYEVTVTMIYLGKVEKESNF